VKASQQARQLPELCRVDLVIVLPRRLPMHVAVDEVEDLAPVFVDAEEPWSGKKSDVLEMGQHCLDDSGARAARPAHGVADAHHGARVRAPAAEQLLVHVSSLTTSTQAPAITSARHRNRSQWEPDL